MIFNGAMAEVIYHVLFFLSLLSAVRHPKVERAPILANLSKDKRVVFGLSSNPWHVWLGNMHFLALEFALFLFESCTPSGRSQWVPADILRVHGRR